MGGLRRKKLGDFLLLGDFEIRALLRNWFSVPDLHAKDLLGDEALWVTLELAYASLVDANAEDVADAWHIT